MNVTFAGARENGIDEDVVEVNGEKTLRVCFSFLFLIYFCIYSS